MKYIPYIIILLLLIVIGSLFVNKPVTSHFVKSSTTVIRHDTIKSDKIIYKDNFIYKERKVYVDSIITDTVITKELIEKYIANYYYIDTLVNDSSLMFIIKDTISQNRIIYRSYDYQQSSLFTSEAQKGRIFLGGYMGVNTYGISSFYIRKKTAFSLNYNFKNKAVSVGIAFKIR